MNFTLPKIISLFQYLPSFTVICDSEAYPVWISTHAQKHCVIPFQPDRSLFTLFKNQVHMASQYEQFLTSSDTEPLSLRYRESSFQVVLTTFDQDDAPPYIVWQFHPQSQITPPLTSQQLGAIGHHFQTNTLQIYNTIAPLLQILDQCGCSKELFYLQIITKSCQELLKSTYNLSEYLQELNDKQYTLELLDLQLLLKNFTEEVQVLLRRSEKHLVFTSSVEHAYVRSDRYKLLLLLLNLLDNAFTHTLPNGCVELCLTETEHAVVVTVRDDGDGIPENIKPYVFEPLYAHKESMELHQSLGLGLYLVKEMVQALGGSILFDSMFHRGTTITLQFPKEDAPMNPLIPYHSTVDAWVANQTSPLYAFLARHCQ